MRILIGYNGTKAATASLHDLRRAGFPDGVEAIVHTVAEPLSATTTEEEAAEVAKSGADLLAKEFDEWQIRSETSTGLASQEILEKAVSLSANIIVVGAKLEVHLSPATSVGATSQAILDHAKCSVRIARGTETVNSSAARILVGFDGSVGALHAVETIAARTWPEDTIVRLLAIADSHVLSSIGRFTPQMRDAAVEARMASQWAETLAAMPFDKLRMAGLRPSVEVRFGNPSDVIIQEADRWRADTIFVGPNDPPIAFGRPLSVSTEIASRANCTVEVVRQCG
jgi:nucleotide-binding universal stress UspA family protein